jgi:hypothetical protein
MNKAIAIPLAVGVTLLASTAAAQEAGTTFSNRGTFVISAERLGGLTFTNDTEDNNAGTQETQTTTTNFALGPNLFIYSQNPFVQPQLGFDFFVIDHLSVGAGLSFWKGSGEQEPEGEPSDDLPDITLFRITPRVGYGMMFTPIIGLWARGGIGYYSFSSESDNGAEGSEHSWYFTAEGYLMISPIDHFAIEVGPTVDIGFGGEAENDPANPNQPTTNRDVSRKQYGIAIGLTGWF